MGVGMARISTVPSVARAFGANMVLWPCMSDACARPEGCRPGNATVLVTNDRVDIWIGDQSPQETRFSAATITATSNAPQKLSM